jgi:polyisoprenoid-binding protein YceI
LARFVGNFESFNPTRKFAPFMVATFVLGMIVGGILGGVAGVFLFIRVTGANDQPSVPISAPTLSFDDQSVSIPTQVPSTPTASQNSAVNSIEVTIAPTSATNLPTSQLFRIASQESLVRFAVEETIPAGTAIGMTNQVAGDFIIDFTNPSNSQLGTIRINLRTLRTNDPNRDNSIRCCVLLTAQDAYEFTDFVPTSIVGLPPQVSFGETVGFQVTGDLALRGLTRSVTFDVSLTLESDQVIRGIAQTIVSRSDFGILDDEMLAYHGVADQITLEFDFVARAATS